MNEKLSNFFCPLSFYKVTRFHLSVIFFIFFVLLLFFPMFVGLALFQFSSISNGLLPVLLLLLFLSLFLAALTLQSWHCYSAFQLNSPKAEATFICSHKINYINSNSHHFPGFFPPQFGLGSFFASAYAYTKLLSSADITPDNTWKALLEGRTAAALWV